MEEKVLQIIEASKVKQNYELLPGWTIRRNYVMVRNVLDDHERYQSFDIFRVIVIERLLIIADLDYKLVEWEEIV